jgi:hypothetical protein
VLAAGFAFAGTVEQRLIVEPALMLPSLAWIAMMRHFGFLSVQTASLCFRFPLLAEFL